jgi:hypothetical protein
MQNTITLQTSTLPFCARHQLLRKIRSYIIFRRLEELLQCAAQGKLHCKFQVFQELYYLELSNKTKCFFELL